VKYFTTINETEYEIDIDHDNQIRVNGEVYEIDFQQLPEGGMVSLLLQQHSLEAAVEEREGNQWEVLIQGELYEVQVQDERTYRLATARGEATAVTGEVNIKAPMPGLIIAVPVTPGQTVHKGDKIVILESMKMENELRSPRDGVVLRVNAQPGGSVEKDAVLVVIGEPEEKPET
jgi:biotin carboxyl carrier protein